jgi:hypothetical protein
MTSNHCSIIFILLFTILIINSGCEYRKGDTFNHKGSPDSLVYTLAAKGSGKYIINKVNKLYIMHDLKYDDCNVVYVSDSATIIESKSILLFNSILPNLENDLLTKGFMGTLRTKQKITYMVVTKQDLPKYFTPVKKH